MKILKNGKELEKEKYSLETTKCKEIFRSLEGGLKIDCGGDCEIWCWNDCEIYCCGRNCRIWCENNCKIICWDNCKIKCCEGCKITTLKGTEIKYYYKDKILKYKFKKRKTILCKGGKFVEK